MHICPAPACSVPRPTLAVARFLEILVATALIASGLIGTLHWLYGRQADSLDRYLHAEAVQQAAAMQSRLQADRKGALAGNYDGDQIPTACARPGSDAGPKAQAQYRLCLWQLDLALTLPGGRAKVQTTGAHAQITVLWRSASGRNGIESHAITVQP